ncbi:MAG: TasA family protein [Actinomycetota bacterium]|nr:TasA family protein [Actinomycetota bacterium]
MKRTTIAAAFAVCALCLVAAGAYFSGQAQVPENMIRAGSVDVSTEPTSAALSIEGLAPGGTVEKTLTVRNSGSIAETIVVTGAKKLGITDFYEALVCTVTHEGSVIYAGPMSGLRTAPVAIQPGARANLRVSVGLPATAGNDLEGDYVKMTLYVDAEQLR